MIPWFELHVVSIGPVPIQVWGFWVALGVLVGTLWLAKRAQRAGMNRDRVYDLALWILLGSFIGARVFHVAFYEPAFYVAHPGEVLKVWQGGLSSFGGFVGAATAIWLFIKKHGHAWLGKYAFVQFVDLAVLPLLAGWLIGRIGCVMIHDHPGAPCDCLLAFNHPDGPFLDMALLEILGLLPLFVFLLFTRKKQWGSGWQIAALLMYYGVLRFILDFWRVIDTTYGGLTPAQYLSIVMVLCGAVLLRKNK